MVSYSVSLYIGVANLFSYITGVRINAMLPSLEEITVQCFKVVNDYCNNHCKCEEECGLTMIIVIIILGVRKYNWL